MYLVTLVNAVNHVILLIHCALVVSMLMNAVIEVMLVNASRVAVRDCFTRLLYSGNSVGECRIAVLVRCTLVVSKLAGAVLWKSCW